MSGEETGEEPRDPSQPQALDDSAADDAAKLYYKVIHSKFGEGRLTDEIMQEILQWAFDM